MNIEVWAVFNCFKEFVRAYPLSNKVSAQVLVSELDDNFEQEGAFFTKIKFTISKEDLLACNKLRE